MSSSQLIPTLAECMLFGLTSYFPIENIYSANKDGMLDYIFGIYLSSCFLFCIYVFEIFEIVSKARYKNSTVKIDLNTTILLTSGKQSKY